MIGMSKSTEVSSDIKLIDFGMAKKYLDKDGKHVECQSLAYFQGNRIFASSHAMFMKTTSRKDDLISLYYLIVFLVDNSLPFINVSRNQ